MLFLNTYLFQIGINPSNLQDDLETLPHYGGESPFQLTNMMAFLSTLLGWAIIIGALIIFFCILISGVQWMMAGGDKNSVQEAKSRLTNCLIGFTVLALSYAIALIVQYFFGITILQSPGTTFIAYTPPASITTAPLPTLPPATEGGGPIDGTGPIAPTATGTPTPTVPTSTPRPTSTPGPTGGGGIRYPLDSVPEQPNNRIPNTGGPLHDAYLQDPTGDTFEPNVGCGTGSYRFDGRNGAIMGDTDTDNIIFSNAKNYALATWIRPDVQRPSEYDDVIIDINTTYGIVLTDDFNLRGWHLSQGSITPHRIGSSNGTDNRILPGQWTHVAMVYNEFDKILRFFINGNEISNFPNVLPPAEPSHNPNCKISIGTDCDVPNGSDQDYAGYIDEVVILTDNNPSTRNVYSVDNIRSTCQPRN